MADKEDVKSEVSSSSQETDESKGGVDERGVPLTNRIKELERKLKEKEELLASYETEDTAAVEAEKPQEDPAQLSKQELMRFVENPKQYIDNRMAEVRFKEEIPTAAAWLRSQKGYVPEDDVEVVRIMRENDLQSTSPLKRARTAWRLRQLEKLESEKMSSREEDKRALDIKSTSPEGSGRTVPLKTGLSRKELLSQLEKASLTGNFEEEVRLNELLEEMTYQDMQKK